MRDALFAAWKFLVGTVAVLIVAYLAMGWQRNATQADEQETQCGGARLAYEMVPDAKQLANVIAECAGS